MLICMILLTTYGYTSFQCAKNVCLVKRVPIMKPDVNKQDPKTLKM